VVAEFVAQFKGDNQYWRMLLKDYPKMIKESDRFAKRMLSHDYGDVIAKQFRNYVREKIGFDENGELRGDKGETISRAA